MTGPRKLGRRNGVYAAPVRGAISRRCAKCGAAPGWKCQRLIGDQVVPLKRLHRGR